jgi:tetratricopeptide (TPR) repeat protein
MGLFSRMFGKSPKSGLDLDQALQEAFRMGETKDPSSQKKAIAAYQAIVNEHPDCAAAWYNLGVIQSRAGQWQAAVQSFSQAQKYPDLKIAAAYARLKLLVENGGQVLDADFPEEFRGDNRPALGVQGPCHNAANELRNRGYTCVVEGEGTHSSIVSTVGSAKYTIALSDLFGMLMKNVYREEGGQSVNLSDVQSLSEIDKLRTFALSRKIGGNRWMLKHCRQEIIENVLADLV